MFTVPLESQSLFSCIPTLYINHHRNIDVVFYDFISDFITLISEDDMLEKVPKTKDFYVSARCINTIVSTCVVLGNTSTTILLQDIPFCNKEHRSPLQFP